MHKYLFIAFLCMGQPCFAGETYIRLEPEAMLDHLEVHLGDIAAITTNDPAQSKRLSQVTVARLNTLSIPVRLERKIIEAALIERFPEVRNELSWGSVDSTFIQGKKHSIDLSQGIDSSGAWIVESLGSSSGTIEVVSLDKPQSLELPAGKLDQRPEFSLARWSGDNVNIPLSILVDGVVVAKSVLHFRVRILPQLGDISTVEKSSPVKSKNIQPIKSANANEAGNGLGFRDSKSQQSYMIQKNQHVRVIIENGVVHIESDGIALSDAYAGDTVTVQRTDNKEIFVGRASEPGVVVVEGS